MYADQKTRSQRTVLSTRYKTPVHIVQAVLAIVVLGLAAARLVVRDPNAPMTRSGSMALGMAAKSLVVIAYQLLTEHVARLRRFASLKAYLILNVLEIVFWGAVAFMSIQGNIQSCIGIACSLGWVVVVLAILNSMLATYMSLVSYNAFRASKSQRITSGDHSSMSLAP